MEKFVVPKDSKEEAEVYLRAWWDLHEGEGVARTQEMIRRLRGATLLAGLTLAASVLLGWSPLVSALAGIVLGYATAEAAALKSRLRAWPHNERYFDWEKIRAALDEKADGRPEQE